MADWSPEAVAELKARAKRELRKRMRSVRRSLPSAARMERDARIVSRLLDLPEYRRARGMALFWPLLARQEIDLRDADRVGRSAGKTVYYPFVEDHDHRATTGFKRVDDVAILEVRGHGFHEPPPGAREASRGDLDLIVVPALAASEDGHRIGYGSGFYDGVLPRFCPPAVSVVVIYSFQLVVEVPRTTGDVACSIVLSDAHLMRPGGRS